MKFSTKRWHLIGLYYLAALEKFLSIHDDLVRNRISSATSSLRILLEHVYKGLFIVHCVKEQDLKPGRIAKLWKRQEYNARKKKFEEKDASLNRLAKELMEEVPYLDILRRWLKQVTPSEKTTFIKKLHHAVHGDIEGIRRWAEQGMNSASVRNEFEWLSASMLRFFKISAEFDLRNDLDLDPELMAAILARYEEIVDTRSPLMVISFFKDEIDQFKAKAAHGSAD
ncbi:MAG: hypothetical protein DMG97_39380 [Acidobacteria bacterium]|nr:MAG: hypothetical protein DMG97_39380 [Acidobacteriota bacterium]